MPTPGPRTLTLRELNRSTLARQGLLERLSGDVPGAIGRLAGLQAQHANPPYIALWSRLRGATIAALQAALTDRTVVKATLMRSTLHIVEAADFAAFDVARATGSLATWRPTARRAELDPDELNRRLLEFAHEPRTVAEMEAFLDEVVPDAAFRTHLPEGVRRAAFRIASAAGGLVHVPPSGFWRAHHKPRYIAWDAWLPTAPRPSPDEALSIACERYLAAYGPASVADIGKWAGHPRLPKVRAALAGLEGRLRRYTGPDGRELVDLDALEIPDGSIATPPRFLARWDSALIAYDVRARLLPDAYRAAVIKKNGDFLPTFLVDGMVAGLWWAEASKGEAILRVEPFAMVPKADRAGLDDEAEQLVRFIEPDADRFAVAWAEPG